MADDRDDYFKNAPPIGMGPDGELNLLKPGEKIPALVIIGSDVEHYSDYPDTVAEFIRQPVQKDFDK